MARRFDPAHPEGNARTDGERGADLLLDVGPVEDGAGGGGGGAGGRGHSRSIGRRYDLVGDDAEGLGAAAGRPS